MPDTFLPVRQHERHRGSAFTAPTYPPKSTNFLFVNKNARSTSLSNSRKTDKNTLIQSHVQHWRKTSARERDAEVLKKASSTKYIIEWVKYEQETSAEDDDEETAAFVKTVVSPVRLVSANYSAAACVDPFDSTSIKMDAEIHGLLSHYEANALVTYHKLELQGLPNLKQHQLFPMVQTSMKGCFLNKLHVYTVLAAVAHVPMNQGKSLVSPARAQYFKYKSIQYMHAYFQSRTSFRIDDAQVILDVLFMVATEVYIRDYATASKHMKVAIKLLDSLGSSEFEKYARHAAQASEILLSMETLTAPALPLDWDPGEFPVGSWKRITTWTNPCGQALIQSCQCGLTCPSLGSILPDVATWSRVYQYARAYPIQLDLRWVNYRGNALMHRLLSLTTVPLEDVGSRAVRLTLIILLGCVISRIGLLRSGRFNAAYLYRLLKDCDHLSFAMPEDMELWVVATGYVVTAPGSDEHKWFELRSAYHAKSLGATESYSILEDLMQKYLLLEIHRPNLQLLYDAFPQLLNE